MMTNTVCTTTKKSALTTTARYARILICTSAISICLPAQAQPLINLGKIFKNPADASEGNCSLLLEWVKSSGHVNNSEATRYPPSGRRTPSDVGQSVDPKTAYLISDEVFQKYFSKTYEQLTMQDFSEFQRRSVRACTQAGTFTPSEWQTVRTIWSQQGQAKLLQAAQLQRSRREANERAAAQTSAELERLTIELQQATADNMTPQRLEAIRHRIAVMTRTAKMRPEEQAEFESQLLSSEKRLIPDWLRAKARGALAIAQGPDQLRALIATRESVTSGSGASGMRLADDEPLVLDMQRRERELAAVAAKAERKALVRHADPLADLESGARWHEGFESRWGSTPDVPELLEVQREFVQMRLPVLGRSSALLVKAVQKTTTIAEARDSISRYTLPSESGTTAVTAMQAAVEERIRLIERNEALGHETVAGASADPSQPLPADRKRKGSAGAAAAASEASGEPSEATMYDLVRLKFEKAAQRVRGLYDQCQGGGDRSNPMNMAICVGLMVQQGATGGALASPTRIVKFAKIDCQKSPSRPGYNCEYEIETDTPMNRQFASMTGFQVDESGLGQGRFVRNRQGIWLMITEE